MSHSPAEHSQPRDFKIGDWWVRPQGNELERTGARRRLEARSMSVLVCLARHAPNVVSKRRLLEEVWTDSPFVGDDAISHAVWEIRKALGDSARSPTYIETVARRGYRLIAEVLRPQGAGLPMEGARIDHYDLGPEIGRGAMGVVYQARDRRLDREVALKFLAPELTRDPKACRRFDREARLAASLDHPNLGTVHQVGETSEGHRYLVTSLYRGGSLKERIRRGPVAVAEALDLAGQALAGLGVAHERGIVHRDIKPANLMLDEHGILKICDFGIAKLLGSTDLTRTGSSVGTPAYKSPEQARGSAVDHRSDLWAVAVVLYELLTGRRPFGGEVDQAVMHAILSREPAAADDFVEPGAVDARSLRAFLARALAKDPDERFQSASDMSQALDALARGNSPAPRPDPPMPPEPSLEADPAEPPLVGARPEPGSPPGAGLASEAGGRGGKRASARAALVLTLLAALALAAAWLADRWAQPGEDAGSPAHGRSVEGERLAERGPPGEVVPGPSWTRDGELHLHQALRTWNLGSDADSWAEVERSLEAALDEMPASPEARGARAVFAAVQYSRDKKTEHAVTARRFIDLSRELDPHSPDAAVAEGILLLKAGDVEEAEARFRFARDRRPTCATDELCDLAYLYLGEALLVAGRPEQAIEELERGIDEGGGYVRCRLKLGQHLKKLGRLSEAEAELRAVLQIVSGNTTAQDELNQLLMESGRVDDLSAHLPLENLDPEAWNYKGVALYDKKLWDLARHAFERADEGYRALGDRRTSPLVNIGDTYLEEGREAEARTYFAQALALFDALENPGFTKRALRVVCLAKLGRFDLAIPGIEELLALERTVDSPDILIYAARVYALHGDRQRLLALARQWAALGKRPARFLDDSAFRPYREDAQYLLALSPRLASSLPRELSPEQVADDEPGPAGKPN